LLSAAAETGAKNFIEAVFNSSAGRIVFEAYKGKSPLPEDVAEENGHEEIAAYLRGIAKKYINFTLASMMRIEKEQK